MRAMCVAFLLVVLLGALPVCADDGPPDVREALRMLASTDPARRARALAALDERLEQHLDVARRAVPQLARLVVRGSDAEAAQAALLLGRIDVDGARDALLDTLRPALQRPGRPFEDRFRGLAGAARLNPMALERALVSAVRRPQATEAQRALHLEALGLCSGPASLALLLRAPSEEAWLLAAARALGLGRRVRPTPGAPLRATERRVLSALVGLQEHPHPAVRVAAWEGLFGATGKDWPPGSPRWARWWKEEGGSWMPPATDGGRYAAPDPTGHEPRFYGIPIPKRRGTRVAFCLDISQSMWGEGIAAARRELRATLYALPHDHAFDLVAFNQRVHAHGPGLMAAHPVNKAAAVAWFEAFETVGGTNLFDATALAFKRGRAPAQPTGAAQRLDAVYVLSDGAPNHGRHTAAKAVVRHLTEIAAASGGRPVPIHAVSAGERATDLLQRLAAATGGQFIRPHE